jgi:hypothetical protein
VRLPKDGAKGSSGQSKKSPRDEKEKFIQKKPLIRFRDDRLFLLFRVT